MRMARADTIKEGRPLIARQVESFTEKVLCGFLDVVHPLFRDLGIGSGKRGFHTTMHGVGVSEGRRGFVSAVR